MKHVLFPAALSLCVAAAPTLADERVFDLAGFTEVSAGSGLDVEITQGDAFSVTAEGTSRALKRLEIETRGDRLVIEQQSRGIQRFSPLMRALGDEVVVRVTLPELTAVTASAGSDVSVEGSAAAAFTAEASSGADLELDGIDAQDVTLAASSGAALEAQGRCEALEVQASSGADLEGRELSCETAQAKASSGARIELTAVTVAARASSGAEI
ncbi:MAG: DUF2807 domain-containing protein, partial [Maritimibacter sp.]|nr:DUF2807 domain-containing protein [Maritimibacter sp.]